MATTSLLQLRATHATHATHATNKHKKQTTNSVEDPRNMWLPWWCNMIFYSVMWPSISLWWNNACCTVQWGLVFWPGMRHVDPTSDSAPQSMFPRTSKIVDDTCKCKASESVIAITWSSWCTYPVERDDPNTNTQIHINSNTNMRRRKVWL